MSEKPKQTARFGSVVVWCPACQCRTWHFEGRCEWTDKHQPVPDPAPPPSEWDCEGCGAHVIAWIARPPRHGFCATCAWLSEYLDPEEIIPVLRRCEAMGHLRRADA